MPFEILDDEAPAAAAGGYEILDEETPGTLEGIANSFQRGNLAGQRAIEALQFKDEKPTMRQGRRAFTSAMEDPRYSFGLLDNPDKIESLLGPSARLGRMMGPARESNIATAGNIADLTQRMGAIPQSAAMQEWSKADNSNWWQVFARNPVEITANIFAESLPQASAGMAAGMAGGIAGGPAGAAAGAGTGSFVVEASNAFLDGAAQAGVDLGDPEQVRAFFADEAKVKEARQFAMQRGFPVALFDALTAGVAGKFLKPALGKGVGRVAAASGAEAGVQMAGGAAGEAAAQVTSGQELSGKDIFAEAVGELVTAPGEVVSNLRTELKGFDVLEGDAGTRSPKTDAEKAAPVAVDDLKGLEAAMRGNQLKPKAESVSTKPSKDAGAAEIVMADLPEAARAQLTRRMEQGPATPESLPAPEKPAATGAATVDWNPTEEMRAALEFQKRTDEAVKAAIENPDKEYEAMTRQELELLEALGDGRATAQLRRLQKEQAKGAELRVESQPPEAPIAATESNAAMDIEVARRVLKRDGKLYRQIGKMPLERADAAIRALEQNNEIVRGKSGQWLPTGRGNVDLQAAMAAQAQVEQGGTANATAQAVGAGFEPVVEPSGTAVEQKPAKPAKALKPPKPPTEAAIRRQAANEFDKLLLEHGMEAGWVRKPEVLYDDTLNVKTGHGTASVKARILRSQEMAGVRRRAAQELGFEKYDDIGKPENRALLLPRLKEWIARNMATPEQQAAAFQQAASKGPVNVPTESLKVGDALTIDGEPLRVVEVTPEGEVVLQDGKRFGQQVLTDGTTIYAEDWQSAPDETAGQLPEQATVKESLPVEQKATEEAKPAAGRSIVDSKAFERGYIHINLRGGELDLTRPLTGWVLPADKGDFPNTMTTRYGAPGKTAVWIPKEWVSESKTRPAKIKEGFIPKPEYIAVIPPEAMRPSGTVDWAKVFKAPAAPTPEAPKPAAATPTIKAGQKQGDLLGSGDIPFNLFSEQTQSGERIEAERRQREETERAAKEFEAKNQPDLIESALDKLKIETPPGSLQAFGLLPETWNQLIEIVRKAYRAGKTIAAAIDDGVAWLRKNAQDFDEAAIKDELRQVVGGAEARPEDTLASQLDELQQQLERIELNIIRTRRKGKAQTVRALLDERARLQEEFNRLRYGAEKEATAVEGAAPAPMPEFTQSQLDKVSSATLDGAPSAESFWTRVRKGLRYFATSTPEIAVTGDEAQNAAMFRRGVRLFGVETQNARRTAAREINKVLEPIKALGRDVTNPDAVNQFFKLGKRIRREEGRANPNEEKLAKWRAQQTKVREGLEKNPWYLFQQAVLWRDLWYRGKFLRTPSGGEITLPGGLEIDQVERAMQRNQQLIDANPHGDAVRESLKRHYALMGELQESLLKHGELIPDELRNPLYFPHHLLEKFTGSLERARPTTEKDFRAYLIAPVGSEKLIEAGYINALYKHVNDVTVHNARADVVEKYWRPYDKAAERQQELEEEAAERGETVHPDAWKRNLPPGMDLFTPSEEIPMRADYILNRGELAKALGVALPANGDLRNALVELGAEVRLTGDMIQKALVAGERPQWLLPMEIAEAIRGVVRREEARSADTIGRRVGHVLSKPLQWWKGNTLFNYYNYPRYEWGNTITDVIDKMLGADPGMARYLGRALKEVRDAARGQRTEEFDSAEREGVLQSITAAEVEELARLPEFEDFLTSKQWRMEKVRKFITWTARASAVRESTFRYAKFLADLERIRRGEQPVYAGAYWRDVQAARTPEAKAAEIALKTFGDYGNLSVVGNFLREHVIPFWSWQEINLKYHANLFRNLHDMLTLPVGERPQGARDAARAAALGTATFTARAAVGIALRLALMRLGVELWNQFGGAWAGLWDDDEDLEGQLSEADRRRFHLILGKDENGRVRVVYVPNALSDVAEWFGGNNFARLFTEWAKGDIPFGQFASDYGKQLPTDLVNKVVQGARPDVKFAYMATSGKDPFPDVTNQRDISRENLGWLLMQTVTDRDAATFLRQQLDKDFYAPEDLGDWLGRKLLQIRRRDPEQWAYYEIRDRAADWKEARTGKRNEGFDYQSPDQQVIRNFRKAIYRGDMENAVRFYHRLRDYGYTDKRFAASIRNSDPLSDLTKLERREFERGLTGYERELLARAERYYGRLAASKGREKTLFPSNERSTRRASEEQIRRAVGQ